MIELNVCCFAHSRSIFTDSFKHTLSREVQLKSIEVPSFSCCIRIYFNFKILNSMSRKCYVNVIFSTFIINNSLFDVILRNYSKLFNAHGESAFKVLPMRSIRSITLCSDIDADSIQYTIIELNGKKPTHSEWIKNVIFKMDLDNKLERERERERTVRLQFDWFSDSECFLFKHEKLTTMNALDYRHSKKPSK